MRKVLGCKSQTGKLMHFEGSRANIKIYFSATCCNVHNMINLRYISYFKTSTELKHVSIKNMKYSVVKKIYQIVSNYSAY